MQKHLVIFVMGWYFQTAQYNLKKLIPREEVNTAQHHTARRLTSGRWPSGDDEAAWPFKLSDTPDERPVSIDSTSVSHVDCSRVYYIMKPH